MSWDIYGNPLQRGHCEVHPHVAEEYPCSVCLYEREQHKDATRQCPDCNESEHYLGQAQEHIKELERQRNDLLAALEAFREVGGTEVGGRGMSKYKMVPMEPTIDMVIAGEDAWDTQLDKRLFAKDNGEAFATYPSEETHELCSRVAYRAMLAAAPAVQVEPVGWHTEDHLDDKSATTYSAEVAQRWRDKGWPVWSLYTAPQPAEQQPSAHWSHDNPGLADQYRGEAMAARRSVGFKQDADDVSPTDISAAIESLTRTAAPAVQMEVVGWQFYLDGKWWNGDDRIKDHKRNTQEAGYRIRDVYAFSDGPTLVEECPLVETLESIAEYWNQDGNEDAMLNACEYTRSAALAALAAYRKQGGEV